jgi:hypothetical protein
LQRHPFAAQRSGAEKIIAESATCRERPKLINSKKKIPLPMLKVACSQTEEFKYWRIYSR